MKITVPHCGQMDIWMNALCSRIGWSFLGGEQRNNDLTTEALDNLKRIVEGESRSSMRVR